MLDPSTMVNPPGFVEDAGMRLVRVGSDGDGLLSTCIILVMSIALGQL